MSAVAGRPSIAILSARATGSGAANGTWSTLRRVAVPEGALHATLLYTANGELDLF